MNKILKPAIILLIFLPVIISCEKEDQNYLKTYVLSDYTIGEIKLFTNSGAITDTSIINNLSSRVPIYDFWFNEPSEFHQDMTIEFYSETEGCIPISR